MKFLCSILILAGVFALNDAFPSSDDDDRLAYDTIMLANLQRQADNRDASTSAACSQTYLAALTECLGTYNTGLADCDSATQTKIDGLNEAAKQKIEELSATVRPTCSNDCASLAAPLDGLSCMEEETSRNSGVLSGVSVDASTSKAELTKSVSDAQGEGAVCTQKCFSVYTSQSKKVEDEFRTCTNKKSE